MKHFELWCIQWMPSRLHVLCGWQGDWERKSRGVSLLWLWVYNILIYEVTIPFIK